MALAAKRPVPPHIIGKGWEQAVPGGGTHRRPFEIVVPLIIENGTIPVPAPTRTAIRFSRSLPAVWKVMKRSL